MSLLPSPPSKIPPEVKKNVKKFCVDGKISYLCGAFMYLFNKKLKIFTCFINLTTFIYE